MSTGVHTALNKVVAPRRAVVDDTVIQEVVVQPEITRLVRLRQVDAHVGADLRAVAEIVVRLFDLGAELAQRTSAPQQRTLVSTSKGWWQITTPQPAIEPGVIRGMHISRPVRGDWRGLSCV